MKAAHILVIRVSAMGDVAMTVPVLQQLLQQYPGVHLTVLTQKLFAPLFAPLPRTSVKVIETKGAHAGMAGLYKLFKELKKQTHFDAIADLHNVLRSKLLRFFFGLSGIKKAAIDKGRDEKKKLTAKENKQLVQLKTSFQRYADVFAKLGFPIVLDLKATPYPKQSIPEAAKPLFVTEKKYCCIAPFAKHQEKMYPLEKMKSVVQSILLQPGWEVFLLGGGKAEIEILNEWEKELPGVINLAGRYTFSEELALLSNMDIVVSMDSANMHLASLFGVKVISIWGATHPFAGFYGWGQSIENAVQTELYCRPCSVFGNKPCYRGDHACMEQLGEDEVIKKVPGS